LGGITSADTVTKASASAFIEIADIFEILLCPNRLVSSASADGCGGEGGGGKE
jgi:hypothetical protein